MQCFLVHLLVTFYPVHLKTQAGFEEAFTNVPTEQQWASSHEKAEEVTIVRTKPAVVL